MSFERWSFVATAELLAIASVLSLPVAFAIVVAIFDLLGYTYRRPTSAQLEVLRAATLYHYCDNSIVDEIFDATEGLHLTARGRAFEPFLAGRRAIFFYGGHGPRGGRSNHNSRWRTHAAVFAVRGDDLFAGLDPTSVTVKWRRWDDAVGVVGDYRGPAQLCARDVDVIAAKRRTPPP